MHHDFPQVSRERRAGQEDRPHAEEGGRGGRGQPGTGGEANHAADRVARAADGAARRDPRRLSPSVGGLRGNGGGRCAIQRCRRGLAGSQFRRAAGDVPQRVRRRVRAAAGAGVLGIVFPAARHLLPGAARQPAGHEHRRRRAAHGQPGQVRCDVHRRSGAAPPRSGDDRGDVGRRSRSRSLAPLPSPRRNPRRRSISSTLASSTSASPWPQRRASSRSVSPRTQEARPRSSRITNRSRTVP